jgi:hypothetical protein
MELLSVSYHMRVRTFLPGESNDIAANPSKGADTHSAPRAELVTPVRICLGVQRSTEGRL